MGGAQNLLDRAGAPSRLRLLAKASALFVEWNDAPAQDRFDEPVPAAEVLVGERDVDPCLGKDSADGDALGRSMMAYEPSWEISIFLPSVEISKPFISPSSVSFCFSRS